MKPDYIKEQFIIFLKGLAIGTVTAIPGVSSGTIAMITGVFERIINALKSFDLKAVQLLHKGNFRKFIRHTDLIFLINLALGCLVAVISLAKLLETLFQNYPVYIWAYFFGLVFASVFILGKTIKKWRPEYIAAFLAGVIFAIYIAVAAPGVENDSLLYLILCGAIAICCTILPGTSGAFVLLLMGNYRLVLGSINSLRLEILIPFAAGAIAGLIPFSHFLSWLLNRFRNPTIAVLTGFILGSLVTIWPWKTETLQLFGEKTKVIGYTWQWPQMNMEFAAALVCCILGIATIYLIESLTKTKKKRSKQQS